ncbi:carbohydrate ABC transporter substrate-binding protein (CUT1 family) [Scopulibacillus darangshiensis]|uniref:Carbohydrate ABC transporter substrate-binding protein (CUT1 family) n=1 Tax=Scopulibacillus darangshiensis TaxID=442528 RepID=A0A4R2P666_9BACL|nr:ABC transporter substrate-binding protein [Scopulibacillus darangshiensis]TCP29471.1 carbohydrate ABC transporter substrate-binding protein (CUT1 family) [Scopulibacillus darangshiensis]
MKGLVRKNVLIVMIAILSISLLSGCAGTRSKESSASKEGKVTVDFWTFWGSETRKPVIEKIINDFNKSQDKIYVKHTYLPYGDIWTKELAAVAAGNPPDVVINDINTVQHRAAKNQNTDLSKYIKDSSFKDRFYPQLWQTVLYKNHPYGVPFNTDERVLYYNKDLFKKAGLDPNKPPQTWDELWSYAKKLDVKENGKYKTIGFYPLWGVGADVWMLNADGTSFFDYEKNKPVVNDQDNIDALNWALKFQNHYGKNTIQQYKAQFGQQQANPFIAGKVAMYTEAATFYTQLRDYGKDINWGITKLPAKTKGSGHTSWGGGFAAEIPKGAKHPKEAWEFIKYLTGKKSQAYWAAKNFDLVANKAGAKAAATSDLLNAKGKKTYKFISEYFNETEITPTPLSAPDYTSIINPEIDKAMAGKKSPEQAMNDAQKAVEKLISNHQ